MDEEGYESGAHPLLVLLGLDMVVLFDWAGLPACRMGFIALALTVRTTFASIVIDSFAVLAVVGTHKNSHCSQLPPAGNLVHGESLEF